MLKLLSMGDTPSHLKARMRYKGSEEGHPLDRWSWDFAVFAFSLGPTLLALLAQMLWIWLFLFPWRT